MGWDRIVVIMIIVYLHCAGKHQRGTLHGGGMYEGDLEGKGKERGL